MATGFDVEQFKTFLQCSICLGQFDKPKTLKCGHVFCKGCIENIIKFQGDGSAMVPCPMRCADQTVISKNQTVNDLAASYNIQNMLEALETDEVRLNSEIPVCCYDDNCKKEISVHCCEMMMCQSCYVKHEKSINGIASAEVHQHQLQRKVHLHFSKREDNLKILCDKHVSKCTHLCIDNKFLCTFCLHRDDDHKQHAKNTIESEVTLIKQVLVNESSKVKHFASFDQFLSITEQSIVTVKEKFNELLLQRKEKCLTEYIELLNREEEILKSKFERMCEDHLKQYQVDDIITKYCQEKLEKSDVELVIQKEAILENISKNESKWSVKLQTISVSDDFVFRSNHPLGDIEVTVGKDVSTLNWPISSLSYNIKVDDRKSEEKQENEDEMINSLVDDVERKLELLTEENSTLKDEINNSKTESESNILSNPTTNNVQSTKNVQVFLDIEIGTTLFSKRPASRIVIDLFYDIAPKTCENFVQLCTHKKGFGYRASKFYYVNPYSDCRGGDITRGNGGGGKSIYGEKFQCENFVKKHDGKGIVTMWSNSEGYVNSIFVIMTKAKACFDGQHVVFGKVTDETYNVVEKIMEVKTDGSSKPRKGIVIVDCGILNQFSNCCS